MTIDEVRQIISERTGVPADLLTGETPEEIVTRAKALIALKVQHQNNPQTPKEQFARFMQANFTGEDADPFQDLKDVAEDIREASGGYSRKITDAGEASHSSNGTAKEQFAQFMADKLAYDPFKGLDGWTNHL